jgi:hypothetical protein
MSDHPPPLLLHTPPISSSCTSMVTPPPPRDRHKRRSSSLYSYKQINRNSLHNENKLTYGQFWFYLIEMPPTDSNHDVFLVNDQSAMIKCMQEIVLQKGHRRGTVNRQRHLRHRHEYKLCSAPSWFARRCSLMRCLATVLPQSKKFNNISEYDFRKFLQ